MTTESSRHQALSWQILRSNAQVQTLLIYITHGFLLITALTLWGISFPSIDLTKLTDVGFVSVLPLTFYFSLCIVVVGACLGMQLARINEPFWLAYIALLILILHGTPAMLYEEPRYAWTYKHIGVAAYIQNTGAVNPSIDAYHNWPGFFALSALYTEVAGLGDAFGLAMWAPVFFNFLFVAASRTILRSFSSDERVVRLGIVIFCLTNWVGQDYFSPQAFAFFLHITILGTCLTWLRRHNHIELESKLSQWAHKVGLLRPTIKGISVLGTPEMVHANPLPSLVLSVHIILAFSIVSASHQLTPFVTIVSVAALVLTQYYSQRFMPILMIVITLAWLGYMADVFLDGHLWSLAQDILSIAENIETTTTARFRGSDGRLIILAIRILVSLVFWGIAAIGWSRRAIKGGWDLVYVLLAVLPFPFALIQPYGGEMLLRVYLFSLPFMTLFCAAANFPDPLSGKSIRGLVATIVMCLFFLSGFLFIYFGQERMNYLSKNEVTAAQIVYARATPGSLVLTATWNFPKQYLPNYRDYIDSALTKPDFQQFAGNHFDDADVDEIARIMADSSYPDAYLIISRSQKASATIMDLFPEGAVDDLERKIIASGRFERIYFNDDVNVFRVERPSQ